MSTKFTVILPFLIRILICISCMWYETGNHLRWQYYSGTHKISFKYTLCKVARGWLLKVWPEITRPLKTLVFFEKHFAWFMHRWWPCQCFASSVPSPSACSMTKSQVFLPEAHRLICDCVCNSAIQKACAGSTILSVNLMVVLPVGP
jgi:hypothetical protein